MAQLIDDLLHLLRASHGPSFEGEAVDLCAEALSITEELQAPRTGPPGIFRDRESSPR